MTLVYPNYVFNLEDAKKLAKDIENKKDLLAKQETNTIDKEVEEYIINVLHHIELAIKDNKKNLICNVGNFRRCVINEIIKKFKDLGFTVDYGLEDYSTGKMFTMSFQYIIISGWIEDGSRKKSIIKLNEFLKQNNQ